MSNKSTGSQFWEDGWGGVVVFAGYGILLFLAHYKVVGALGAMIIAALWFCMMANQEAIYYLNRDSDTNKEWGELFNKT